jgi:glutathione S-transferase
MTSGSAWRIFGSELSPYSVKVRSYFRYKGIPHEWVVRNASNVEEFRRHARLPLMPLVIGPDGESLQDSTPILETLEARFPEPGIHPDEPLAAFASALIEEYADEWGNKPMFHYRWTYEPDQRSAAERIARENLPGAGEEQVRAAAEGIRGRMVPRLGFVGSSPETSETIEASFRRQAGLLEAHLAPGRPYLFGARPAFADFGAFAQLCQCASDPTPGAWLRAHAPAVLRWIERMLAPKAEGPFEPWRALEPTLLALLREEIGGCFLPWSDANARALAQGRSEFEVELAGRPFRQQAQKYHARSLAALRARFAAAPEPRAGLEALLERAGCLAWLRG